MNWSEGRDLLNQKRKEFKNVDGRRNDCFCNVIAAILDFSPSGSNLIRWRFVIDGELVEGTDINEIVNMFSGLRKKNASGTKLGNKKYCIWTYNTHLVYWNLKDIMDKYGFEIFNYNGTYKIYELSNEMFRIYDYEIRTEAENPDIWEMYDWVKEETEKFVFPNKIPKTSANNLKEAFKDKVENIEYIKCGHYGYSIKEKKWSCLDWSDKKVVDLFTSAYLGGFMCLNEKYWNAEMRDVDIWDMCSAYPAVICENRLPVRFKVFKGRKDQFEYFTVNNTSYITMGVYKFYGLKLKQDLPPYISSSWCIESADIVESEHMPKVKEAKEVVLALYDLSYRDILEYYNFDKVDILEMYIADSVEVDERIKEFIIECFENKEKYRNADRKRYQAAKEYLNSIYGVMGQRLIYGDEYKNPCAIGSNSIFYYPWGGYISAIQRHTLSNLVKELGENFIYSNTDSIVVKSAASDVIKKWNIDKYGAASEDDIYTIFKLKMLEIFECTEDDIKEGYEIIMNSLSTTGCERTISIFRKNLDEIREKYPITSTSGLGRFKLEDSCDIFRVQRLNRYYYYNKKGKLSIKYSGVENFENKDMLILPDIDNKVKVKDNIKYIFDGNPVIIYDFYRRYSTKNGFRIISNPEILPKD